METETKKTSIKKILWGCFFGILTMVLLTALRLNYLKSEGRRSRLEIDIMSLDNQIDFAIKNRGNVNLNVPRMWGTSKDMYVGRRLDPLHGLGRITSVSVSAPNEPFPEEGMSHLASLPDLERLFFQDTDFDEDVFTLLLEHGSLKTLQFNNCSFTGRGILALQTFADKRPGVSVRHVGSDQRLFW